MPKVGRMDERTKRARRLELSIKAECASNPNIRNITGLAAAMGKGYRQVYEPIHRGTISALLMNDILKALGADNATALRFYKI